jgi:hypothetical protein
VLRDLGSTADIPDAQLSTRSAAAASMLQQGRGWRAWASRGTSAAGRTRAAVAFFYGAHRAELSEARRARGRDFPCPLIGGVHK